MTAGRPGAALGAGQDLGVDGSDEILPALEVIGHHALARAGVLGDASERGGGVAQVGKRVDGSGDDLGAARALDESPADPFSQTPRPRQELQSLSLPRRSQAVQDLPLELCALAPIDQLQTAETGVTTRLTCVPSAFASTETSMSWPALLKLRPDWA